MPEALDSSEFARLASANREDTPSLVGKGECHIACQKSNCIFDGNGRVIRGIVTWETLCWSGVSVASASSAKKCQAEFESCCRPDIKIQDAGTGRREITLHISDLSSCPK
jgi:hypothetical protein